jgi:flavin reductase (DIM6/NTAB) family NADH-FMN oxidoreductase RutF
MTTAADFRRAMGEFVTGVTVVTTVADDTDHAMTANAFTSVSLDPPLVLLCVERVARFDTAVLASGTWAVSVLPATGEAAARWLATRGRPLIGQLDGIAHRRGLRTGAALIAGALATIECRTRARYDGGDHDILLADVLAAEVPADVATDPAGALRQPREPLLYHRGRYARLPDSAS